MCDADAHEDQRVRVSCRISRRRGQRARVCTEAEPDKLSVALADWSAIGPID